MRLPASVCQSDTKRGFSPPINLLIPTTKTNEQPIFRRSKPTSRSQG